MYKNKLVQKAQENDELESASVRDGRKVNARRDLWAQYAAMIESFDGLIYICSQDYEIEFMNQRFIDRTGYDAIGQKCYKALHDREEICPWCVNERVFQGETVRWEMRSPKDNQWYYIVNSPIRHSDGRMSKMSMIQDITERKEMEEALRLAEADYRGIIENAVEGIFRTLPDGRLICVNPAFAKIFGYQSLKEVLANITNVERQIYVDPGRRAILKREMEESGQIQGFEHQAYRKDRSRIWVSMSGRAVKDDNGAILYYEGFVEDITARKEAEEALLKAHDELECKVAERTRKLARVNQELRLRLEQLERAEAALQTERQRLYSLLDGLPMGVHLVAPNYSIHFANKRFYEAFGGKTEPRCCHQVIEGSDQPCEYCHAARVFETGIPQQFELIMPDGEIHQVCSYPFADIDGSPLVLVLGMNITEQRRAEEKLRESEGRFRQLIEQAADAIFLHDQGKIIEVNQRACDSLGYTQEELLGLSIFDLEVDLAEDSIKKNWQPGNDGPRTIRGTHRRKDGTTFPVEVRAANFEFGGRRLRLNLVRDISERVEAEAALQESEKRYRLLAENVSDVIWTADPNLRVTYISPSVKFLRGFTPEEVLGQRLEEILTPASLELAWRTLAEGMDLEKRSPDPERSWTLDLEQACKDGSTVWTEVRASFLRDGSGHPVGILGITRDISKRKEAEEALRESEKKLRSLANQLLGAQENERKRLAAELHDELGHSLLTLKLRLKSFEEQMLPQQKSLKKDLKEMLRTIGETIEEVRRLYLDLSPGDLEDLGLTGALRAMIEDFTEVNQEVAWSVKVDNLDDLFPSSVQTAVYRIVQEALTNIGKHAKARHVSLVAAKEDQRVFFNIEDDGKGFNREEVLAMKKTLGLLAMEERVKILGGSFELWSQKQHGTRISFTIPIPGQGE